VSLYVAPDWLPQLGIGYQDVKPRAAQVA